jgi:hypothetical protein
MGIDSYIPKDMRVIRNEKREMYRIGMSLINTKIAMKRL